ncbi:hypothetical protein AX17_005417 [Amanita inopinata Kibby_2008]|nr:hypothetical protein AX17_005417 [Amanita inopinata Kibby_2008]
MSKLKENVLVFGDSGATVTFLLRATSVFDNDEGMQKHIKAGNARLVQGDALVQADVKRAWEEASKDKPVSTMLFTIGFHGTLGFHPIKGLIIDPPNLVTQCLLNILTTMPRPGETSASSQHQQPRIVVITSMGLTHEARRWLPLPLRLLYGYSIPQPHRDKVGAERVIWHCSGRNWVLPEPSEEIMGPDWMNCEGLPAFGSLTQTLIVRPAMLTNGRCTADKLKESGEGAGKAPYRVGDETLSGWTISRRDVAHFIVEDALKHWDQYQTKTVSIAY